MVITITSVTNFPKNTKWYSSSNYIRQIYFKGVVLHISQSIRRPINVDLFFYLGTCIQLFQNT